MDRQRLSPAQLEVVDHLMALGGERPTFRRELRGELRALLETQIADLTRPPGIADTTRVNKGGLSQLHACEAHFVSQAHSGFDWNARNARGTVVHKALELSVSFGDSAPPPGALVEHALASLKADDRSLSDWLNEADPFDVAELRAAANETVAKFFECWPPLLRAWSPRSETTIATDLCGDTVRLTARVDLVLGTGNGMEARALVVDLKTGEPRANHLDDLRFYALVHTLRLGVPPFRVASYYLDTATFHAEDVTEDLLVGAARRVAEACRRILELEAGLRAPTITPGPQCSWCQLNDSCDGAARWQAQRAEFG